MQTDSLQSSSHSQPAEGAANRFLRKAASIATPFGAFGSAALMLWVGRHNASTTLLVNFAVWTLLPFVGLILVSRVSKNWPSRASAIVHLVTLTITLASLLVYANVAFGHAKTKSAFPFIVVPPITWIIIFVTFPIAAFVAGKRRVLAWFAGAMLLALIAIGGLCASVWAEHKTDLTLPEPTGAYAVGRLIYDWKDDAHTDPMAPAGAKRELLVWIWYPTVGKKSQTVSDYVPAELKSNKPPRTHSFFDSLTRDWSKVHSRAVANSDLAESSAAFPVVIMRTGASLSVLSYSTLAEDLASHGYFVVGFDAPYRTARVMFPDGRVFERTEENNPERYAGQPHAERLNDLLAAWIADMRFILDRLEVINSEPSGKFAHQLDLTRIGVFGHSFGGAQAAQLCSEDLRCKAGIDIDGRPLGSVIETGLKQPFMFLLSDQDSSSAEGAQIQRDIHSIYNRLPKDSRAIVKIRSANHFFFSDDGALLKSHELISVMRKLGFIKIDGRRQLAATTHCVHTFFDACLKTNSALAKIVSPLYPEVERIE